MTENLTRNTLEHPVPVHDKIIRIPATVDMTGVSRSTLYRMEKSGKFPKRIRISERASGWRLSDVQAWIKSRDSITEAAYA